MCFSPNLDIGCWGGGGGGGVPRELVWLFNLPAQKLKFQKLFFDIVTTLNDLPRYIKHVAHSTYVFFITFGYWVLGRRGGGGGW